MNFNIETPNHPDIRFAKRPIKLPKKDVDKCCHAITINKPPAEVYAFFESHHNFNSFVSRLDLDSKLDVGLVRDAIKRTISWYSTEQSEIKTMGHIWFNQAAQNLGTVATLVMDYSMPGGKLTELIEKFKGEDIDSLILTNLKQIKCFIESGEIATTEGQSSGRQKDEDEFQHKINGKYIH